MHFTIQREAFLKPLKAVAGVVERRSHVMHPILSNVLIEVTEKKIFLTTTDQEVELNASCELGQGATQGEAQDSVGEVQGSAGEAQVSSVQSSMQGSTQGSTQSANFEATPGKITVPLRKLMEICRTLPEGANLTLKEEEQDKVSIRAGRSRFSLSSLPAAQFPAVTESKQGIELRIVNKSFKQLIDNLSFAMAEQDVRYYLNGMLLEMKEEGLYGVAADGHRLALSVINEINEINSINPINELKNDIKRALLRLIVPRKGVLELQRVLEDNDEIVTLILSPQHLCVKTQNINLTTKLLEGKFPDYERIIPQGGDKVVVGKRTLLKEAFLRAAALFSDKSRGVKLRLTSGCLNILATNTDQDEVEEDLEVDYQGEELEIGFNIKYLIDFLTVIQDEWIKFTFTNSSSSARVEGVSEGSQVYVIMPMKI